MRRQRMHPALSARFADIVMDFIFREDTTHAIAAATHWHRQLNSYITRLWWHCYWLQVLENQPDIEDRPLVPGMERLPRPMDPDRWGPELREVPNS